MSSLAILILTKNEEDNIVDVVENAKQCTPKSWSSTLGVLIRP